MLKLLQRTLDLFAPEPEPEPVGLARPEPLQPLQQVPPLPTQTLEQALAPAMSRHPDASREALLSGVLVAFALRRGKRRTIGFSVGPEGLSVSAPKWVPLAEIDRSVQEKSSWILKKLQETRERHRRMESARVDWQDGAGSLARASLVAPQLLPVTGVPRLRATAPPHSSLG